MKIERKIIIALITSKKYLHLIQDDWKPEYIQNDHIKVVSNWCWEYFKEKHKAPKEHIETIFYDKLKNKQITEDLGEIIESTLLPNLSKEYNRKKVNIDYLVEKTLKYFKERKIELLQNNLDVLVDKGSFDEAEKHIKEFVVYDEKDKSSEIDVGDKAALKTLEEAYEESSECLIPYPGALGQFWNDKLVRNSFVSVMATEKRGKCLPANQEVSMQDGSYYTIKELIQNKKRKTISFNTNTNKFEKDEITAIASNGIKPVYILKTKTGRTIQATNNHPFLTPTGWKELKELSNGDFVGVPKKLEYFGSSKLSKDTIRLLAFIIADGSTTQYSTVQRLGYTKKDKKLKKLFTKTIKNFNCQTTWNGIEAMVINSDGNKHKQNKNYAINTLQKYPSVWDKKSEHKEIPKEIFRLTKKRLSLFLRVLFSGDGWCIKDEIGYSSASKTLTYQVQKLLTKYGIICSVRCKKTTHKDSWYLSIRDYENMLLFKKEIGFIGNKKKRLKFAIEDRTKTYKSFLDRIPNFEASNFFLKIQKDVEIPQKQKAHISLQIRKGKALMRQSFIKYKNTKTGQYYLNSDILWDEIVSIDYYDTIETYDLEVKNNHNFIAENFIVHNSFLLLDMMIRAYRHGRKVAFFQAGDMTASQQVLRTAIYLAKKSNKEKFCQEQFIPKVDCIKNQLGTCTKILRESNIAAFDNEEIDAEYIRTKLTFNELVNHVEENPHYRPCSDCDEFLDQRKKLGSIWLSQLPAKSPLSVLEAKQVWSKHLKKKGYIKISTHDNDTLKVSKINSILERWESVDNFVPDIILIDYADLLVPENSRLDFRHQQNSIWKNLRGMSQKRKALVIAPTQADGAAYKKDTLTLDNYSEDKRKYAHVTAMFGLNQDVEGREKKLGLMRINSLVMREDAFHFNDQVYILQKLPIGKPILGSFF